MYDEVYFVSSTFFALFSSQDSTGSKNTASSGSELNTSTHSSGEEMAGNTNGVICCTTISEEAADEEVLEAETPPVGLLRNLTFVSPKSGVYRPMPDNRKRHNQNCSIM